MLPDLGVGLLKILMVVERKRLAFKFDIGGLNEERKIVPKQFLLGTVPKIVAVNGYLGFDLISSHLPSLKSLYPSFFPDAVHIMNIFGNLPVPSRIILFPEIVFSKTTLF